MAYKACLCNKQITYRMIAPLFSILWNFLDIILEGWILLKKSGNEACTSFSYLLVKNRVLALKLYRSDSKQLVNIYEYDTTFQIFLYFLTTYLKISKPLMLFPDEIVISPGDFVIITFIDVKIPVVHDTLDEKTKSKVNLILNSSLIASNLIDIPNWIQVDAILNDESCTAIDLTKFFNTYKLSFSISKITVETLWEIAKKIIYSKHLSPIKHLEVINSNFEMQIWKSSQIFKV